MGLKTDWRLTALILLSWILWLSFTSALPLPVWLLVPMTSVVLLYGAYLWDITTAAFIILAMSWLHHVYSITPPGLYWLSLFLVFLALKVATSQFALNGPFQIFWILVGACLTSEILQLYLMSHAYDELRLSWRITGPIISSAIVQGLVGLLFTRSLLARSQMES